MRVTCNTLLENLNSPAWYQTAYNIIKHLHPSKQTCTNITKQKVPKANLRHPAGAQSPLPYIWSIIGTVHAALPAFMAYIVGRVGCGRGKRRRQRCNSTRTAQTMAEIRSRVLNSQRQIINFPIVLGRDFGTSRPGCRINHGTRRWKHQYIFLITI